MGRACAFEVRQGEDHAQLARKGGKAGDQGMAGHRQGQIEILGPLGDAEIGRGEKFLDLDQLRAPGGGGADQRLGPVGIGGEIPAAGELGGGNGDLAHGDPFSGDGGTLPCGCAGRKGENGDDEEGPSRSGQRFRS